MTLTMLARAPIDRRRFAFPNRRRRSRLVVRGRHGDRPIRASLMLSRRKSRLVSQGTEFLRPAGIGANCLLSLVFLPGTLGGTLAMLVGQLGIGVGAVPTAIAGAIVVGSAACCPAGAVAAALTPVILQRSSNRGDDDTFVRVLDWALRRPARLTPPAVTAWAVHLGWLTVDPTLHRIGSIPAALILTLLAVGELVVDKLPNTPSRTALPGLIGRIMTGGLCGACVAMGGGANAVLGAALGVAGGLTGCLGGYQARTRLVKALGGADLVVAPIEDAVAIGGSLFVVTRF